MGFLFVRCVVQWRSATGGLSKTAGPYRCRAVEPSSRRAVEPSSRRAVEPSSRRAVEPSSRRALEPSSPRAVEPSSRRAVDCIDIDNCSRDPCGANGQCFDCSTQDCNVLSTETTFLQRRGISGDLEFEVTDDYGCGVKSRRAVEPLSRRAVEPSSRRAVGPSSRRAVEPSTAPTLTTVAEIPVVRMVSALIAQRRIATCCQRRRLSCNGVASVAIWSSRPRTTTGVGVTHISRLPRGPMDN